MDGGAWWAAVHGVAKSQTWLSDFIFTFHFHALEKEMATHSSVLAWRIPGTGEPGGLPSMGSQRVGHNWSDLAAAAACMRLEGIFFKKQLLHSFLGGNDTWFCFFKSANQINYWINLIHVKYLKECLTHSIPLINVTNITWNSITQR